MGDPITIYEIQVIVVFITFHTFLIAVVRPFSFTFSKNLLERIFNDIAIKTKSSSIEFQDIESYRNWEGGIMHFACIFWILAILVGASYTLQKFKPIPILSFHSILFLLFFAYLCFTVHIMWIQQDFLRSNPRLWGTVILLFYIIPSLLYSLRNKLVIIVTCTNLSIIYWIWFLSAVQLLVWHYAAAKWGPLEKLRRLYSK